MLARASDANSNQRCNCVETNRDPSISNADRATQRDADEHVDDRSIADTLSNSDDDLDAAANTYTRSWVRGNLSTGLLQSRW